MNKLNRRSFLAAAAAAFSLDPDRLLWVRGAKVYSLPPKPKLYTTAFDTITLAGHPIGRVVSLSVNGMQVPIDPFFLGVGDKVSVSFPDEGPIELEIKRVTLDANFKFDIHVESQPIFDTTLRL